MVQVELEADPETLSESGSFHAVAWEEERTKRSLVKWAGEELDLDKTTGSLRRAPTPFPKEMRAMAKKVTIVDYLIFAINKLINYKNASLDI